MTPEEELDSLRRKLKAREGKGGMSANVEAIKARIATLEAEIEEGGE